MEDAEPLFNKEETRVDHIFIFSIRRRKKGRIESIIGRCKMIGRSRKTHVVSYKDT